MKATKIVVIFVLVIGLFLVSCERSATEAPVSIPGPVGPEGPQGEVGPAGPQGEDGFDGLDGKNFDPNDPEFKAILDQVVAEQIALAQLATVAAPVGVDPTAEPAKVIEIVPVKQTVFGKWNVSYFDGVTTQMESWSFLDLDPALWPVFPNVDNAGYPAANGVEYGMAESVFCQQDQTCDFEVAARHYRLFTGDYNIAGLSCEAKDGVGCAVVFFNVGDVTAFWASQKMQDGFTVSGRYWNGEVMPHAIWALLSNTVSNMLNLNSPLNQNGGANAGANCSVPGGCVGVDVTFVVSSGNQVLVTGHTIYNK